MLHDQGAQHQVGGQGFASSAQLPRSPTRSKYRSKELGHGVEQLGDLLELVCMGWSIQFDRSLGFRCIFDRIWGVISSVNETYYVND